MNKMTLIVSIILLALLLVIGIGSNRIVSLNKAIEKRDIEISSLYDTIASKDVAISSLKCEVDALKNAPSIKELMAKKIYTKRLQSGAVGNQGDWRTYLGADCFVAEEDLAIVGFDFLTGFCGLTAKPLVDGEYHAFAELSTSPEWGQSGRFGFVGAAMAIENSKTTVEVFDNKSVQFKDGNYIDFPKGSKLFLHFTQTAPTNGNSTSGFDATIYYIKKY